jgi:hypothetical protein
MDLDRDKLLAISRRPVEVLIPEECRAQGEGDLRLWVLPMSQADRQSFVQAMKRDRRNGDAKLAVRVLCDPDGTLQFEPSEWELLKGVPSKILDAIVRAANRVSTFSEEETEELEKNFRSRR